MLVYNPKDLYGAWPAFYAFVDFIIRMIKEEKIEARKSFGLNFSGASGGSAQFEIWLMGMWNKDLDEQLKISFAYMPYRGTFVRMVAPIRSFEFSLVQGVTELFRCESNDPKSYDKMLELFKVVMGYLEKYNPDHHKRVLESVNLDSLERTNWKKSKKEIENEFNERWETRKAAEDFERKRREELSKLQSNYKSQGYEITD